MNRICLLLLVLPLLNSGIAQYIPPDPINDPLRSSTGYCAKMGQVVNTDGYAENSVKFVSHGAVPRVYTHEKSMTSFVLQYMDSSGVDTIVRLDMKAIGTNAQEVEPDAYGLKDVFP